jgi:hypothetical protein
MIYTNYKWVDSDRKVVHCISADGKSYKSMQVVGRDNIESEDFTDYKKWIADDNTVTSED